MEVLIEKKMIEIKSEPLEVIVDNHYHHKSTCGGRRRSSSTPAPASPGPPAAELEPSEEFPILYGLLTAPKSFKPKNSEELQLLPPLELFNDDSDSKSVGNVENEGVLVTSRVQLVKCHRSMGSSAGDSGDDEDDEEEVNDSEEIDSQNFDLSSRSSSSSPHLVDSSSSLSSPSGESHKNGEEEDDYMSEDESVCSMLMGSPEDNSCSGGDDSLDDNIPTSTTSGFKRKACRLETAIGNIVRRRVRVQKRSSNNNVNSSNVPISMAPSSPTVSTTCVDPPTPPPSRGRSEILERILRSTNNTTPNQQNNRSAQRSPAVQRRAHNNDDVNNNDGGYDGPYAKLRDLLTMPEDQLVKRRRLEYGLNENSNVKVYGQNNEDESSNHSQRRREFSPPRNNILASLLQKGRAPYEPTSSASPYNQHHHHPQMRGRIPALVSVNGGSKLMMGGNSRANVIVNLNDDRPYKCSLCDLRFKKLPLLNRHVKTHSHIKRYVCRFCSHAFKRSDNLLAHMRTSCKGIKESDAKFAGQGVGSPRPSPNSGRNVNANSQNQQQSGQIIPQLLSAPPTAGGPLVSRSQLEEALLLNLRAHHQEDQVEKRYQNSSPLSPLVSTTTASPPPSSPVSSNSSSTRRPADFHSRHSKLLEILSGSPVNRFPVPVVPVNDVEEEEQPLPLILRGSRRTSTPACSPSSSSQFLRSHHNQLRSALYPNELPLEDDDEEEQVDSRGEEVENDMEEQPLNLGRPAVPASPAPVVPSVKSRDHPEIVSILSRQPKSNVVMLAAADLRKLVGIDTL